MKTIITIVFYHDKPFTIDVVKLHIEKLIRAWFNINEVFIDHKNR